MLQKLHNKIHGWFANLLLGLISITFIFCGVGFGTQSRKKTVVKVGNYHITEPQVEQAYDGLRTSIPKEHTINQGQIANLKKRALQNLVDRAIHLQIFNRLGLAVSEEAIGRELRHLPIFQEKGEFSKQKLLTYLANEHLSFAQLAQGLREQMVIEQLETGILDTEFILPEEGKQLGQLLSQQREIGVLSFKTGTVKSAYSAAQLQGYYQQHQGSFLALDKVRLEYLILATQSIDEVAKPTLEECRGYYEEHLHAYTLPRRWETLTVELRCMNRNVETVNQFKKEGEQLKQHLVEHDSVVANANLRSQRGWLVEESLHGRLLDDLRKAKPGEVLEIEVKEDVLVLIKVLKDEQKYTQPFNEVAEQIAVILQRQGINKAFNETSNELTELVYNNPYNLQIAAERLALPLETTGWLTREEVEQKFSSEIGEGVFNPETIKQGYSSNLLEFAPGKVLVFRVIDYQPTRVKDFEEVKEEIEKIVKELTEHEARVLAAKDCLQALEQKSGTEKEIAAKYGLRWQYQTLKGELATDSLAERAFHLTTDRPYGIINEEEEVAVIVLKQTSTLEKAKTIENLERVVEEYRYSDFQAVMEAWTKQIKVQVKQGA